MSYLFAIFLFSFLIFIHELGHFLAAKAFDVQVNEFSVFMGPVLWQKQKGETLYSVRAIPLGGFCSMEGETESSSNPRSFEKARWWKRFIILVAGAAMNFLAGLMLLAVFYAPSEHFIVPVISQVDEGCAFAEAIQVGDRIHSLDGEKIYTHTDFSMILSMNPGVIHDLVLIRDGKRVKLDNLLMVKREFPNEDGTSSFRYGFSFTIVDASFIETIKFIWNSALENARLVRLSLKMLLTGGAGVQDLSGPVGIVQGMAEVADASPSKLYAFMNLVYFGGFIAINLAVMNLLPLPALDGGRIVGLLLTTGIEGITRRKINPKYEGYIHSAGMVFLLLLMAAIMFKDIIYIFKR